MTDETTLAPSTPAEATTPAVDETVNIDAPVTPETPEAPPTEAVKPEEAKPEDADSEDPDKPKKPTGSQRLKRRLAAIESEFSAAQAELETLRQRQTQANNPQARPGVDREPTEADYPNDYFAFQRALQKWDVQQVINERDTREKQQRQATLRNEQIQEYVANLEDDAEVARERIPDFDKVVRGASDVKVSQELQYELLASNKPALLQYHLAQHPETVRELNGMSGRELVREIARLESRLHLPKPKTATQATPPLSQPKGGAAAPFDPNTTNDMEAFSSWLKKDLKRRSGRA